jgi:two-component system cell cycle response regulator
VDQLVRKERAYTRLLRELAVTDALTGASNRRFFIDSLERELQRAARFGFPVSVVLLDIDHFKAVNDTLGHIAGDRVLQQVVKRLAGALRDSDLLARYGGEEFVILLSHLTLEQAGEAAARFRRALVDQPFLIDDAEHVVTASFGVACSTPELGLGVQGLLRRADAAMYLAKGAGRDRVERWSEVAGGEE